MTGNNRESFGWAFDGWFEKPVCDGAVCVRRTAMWVSTNGMFLCQMHQYLTALVSVLLSKNVVTVLASLGLILNQKTHYTSIVSPRGQ